MAESPSKDYSGFTLKSLLENPDLLQPPVTFFDKMNDKEKELEDISSDAQMSAAFLGPTLWDKTLKLDASDFQLESMDLDDFLLENGILLPDEGTVPVEKTLPEENDVPPVLPVSEDVSNNMQESDTDDLPQETETLPTVPSASPVREPGSPVTVQVDFALSPTDIALATAPGQEEFNPRQHSFTDEDLKPQPMIKKAKKIYVPDDRKDEKYWERRKKNNVAAKRSRDARRIKENQIAIKASFLSKENDALKSEAISLKKEVLSLKKVISNYEKRIQILTEKLGE
ncbi:thyrotroph embryonic factor-like [Ptychodera flava]|uniref:thyrotroph embryonic factor-like n=1 Tax=Ptychodera flava TaxID=63121 RepID=UPI00396A018B